MQAAVNLSAHASRTSLEVLRDELLPHLQETAAAIERDLALAVQTPGPAVAPGSSGVSPASQRAPRA